MTASKGAAPVDQAGGIAMRDEDGRVSVLVVRARKDPSLWIFPKGHIEKGESAEEAALREMQEEAGVHGEIVAAIGEPVEFLSGRELVRVQYFLIRATSERQSPEGRAKRWLPLDEAPAHLTFGGARRLVNLVRDALR